MMETIAGCVMSLASFLLFTCVVIYVFALLGMAFFAGKLRFEIEHPGYDFPCQEIPTDDVIEMDVYCKDGVRLESARMNFDNLINAFLSIFTVMIARDWHQLFYDCIRGVGFTYTISYFVPLIVIL